MIFIISIFHACVPVGHYQCANIHKTRLLEEILKLDTRNLNVINYIFARQTVCYEKVCFKTLHPHETPTHLTSNYTFPHNVHIVCEWHISLIRCRWSRRSLTFTDHLLHFAFKLYSYIFPCFCLVQDLCKGWSLSKQSREESGYIRDRSP